MKRLFWTGLVLTLVIYFGCTRPARASDMKTWETSRLYQYGTDKLKAGKDLLKAIDALKIAESRDDKSVDFKIALGCAYASRYASVAIAWKHALYFVFELAEYEGRMSKWEAANNDRAQTKPMPPPPAKPNSPVTIDDNVPFTMSRESVIRALENLGNDAKQFFGEAVKLAGSAEKDILQQTLFAHGWGLMLIERFGENVVLVPPSDPLKTLTPGRLYVANEEIIGSFKRLTNLDRENASAWYSLAVSLVPKLLSLDRGFAGLADYQELEETAKQHAARAAIDRALEIQPYDFQTLYLAGLIYSPTNKDKSADLLTRAANHSAGNAVLRYHVATINFERAEVATHRNRLRLESAAWQAVELGNKSRKFEAMRMIFPVPSLLQRAWASGAPYGLRDDIIVRDLGSRLNDISKASETNGDVEMLLRSCFAQIGMASKVFQATKAEDLDLRDITAKTVHNLRKNWAATFVLGPYVSVRESQANAPDKRKEKFLNDNIALFEQMKAWDLANISGTQ